MALLVLSKGRRPIVMAKVKYGDGDDWNQHRRDAAHLTEYTEEAWGLGLTWQVMDPAKASVEDLLQAPVLYISGSQAPTLAAARQETSRLRRPRRLHLRRSLLHRFQPLRAAFRQLMAAVFPEPEYKLQPIPPGHPVWRMQDLVRPDSPYAGRLVRRRIRLPHLRRLLRSGSLLLLGTRPPRPVEPLPGRRRAAHCRRARHRRQRAHLRHQPRAKRQRTKLRHATRRRIRFRGRQPPRRHRNRQTPPRRRLQRRPRRAAQPAPHRLARRT